MTHTPGPWEADISDGWGDHTVESRAGRSVCKLFEIETSFAPDDFEAIANARLIAAAPELLESLEYLVAILPDPELDDDDVQKELVIKARAAIAKATGEQA